VPIVDGSGTPRYLLGISEDISDRKAEGIRSRYGVLNPAGTPPHFGLDDPPPDPLLLRCA
jgi:hypothetical protein